MRIDGLIGTMLSKGVGTNLIIPKQESILSHEIRGYASDLTQQD